MNKLISVYLFDIGWFLLKEGDMLWVRDLEGSTEPMDDALRFYFVGTYVFSVISTNAPQLSLTYPHSSCLTEKQQSDLTKLTEEVLGPLADRTPDSAKSTADGGYIGGTRYERSKRAQRVKPDTRCYTNGHTHQIPPNISAPAACLKVGDGPVDDGLQLRQKVNLVRTPTHFQMYPYR